MIYFIQQGCDGPIKIGYSNNNVYERLISLQIGNPNELKLIEEIPGTRRVEKKLHKRFSNERIRGEWFEYSERLKLFIENGCDDNPDLYKNHVGRYLKVCHVANTLDMTPKMVKTLIDEGNLSAIDLGGKNGIRISLESFEALIERSKVNK